jgi:hypothetical protein
MKNCLACMLIAALAAFAIARNEVWHNVRNDLEKTS